MLTINWVKYVNIINIKYVNIINIKYVNIINNSIQLPGSLVICPGNSCGYYLAHLSILWRKRVTVKLSSF